MNTLNVDKIKVIAMDLDGTLTQHKQPLTPENRAALEALAEKYHLVMAGAGQVMRIFNQLEQFPIDVIGNYGLQYGKYNAETKGLDIVRDEVFPCDRESVDKRVTMLREKYGFTEFRGENTEFHPSGCVTFPVLGTKAAQADKLAFDPDRSRRRPMYDRVKELFPEYTVFIGGSSSFDLVPTPHDKYYALANLCAEEGYSHDEVLYVGDDYGVGGNDEAVAKSDIAFVTVDDYTKLCERLAFLL